MFARSFNLDSDDEDGGQPQASNEGDSCNESGTESDDEEDVKPPPAKKKRAASEPRVWTEMNCWHSIDATDEFFLIFVLRKIDELNSCSGLLHIPGSHKSSKNDYGDFQFWRRVGSEATVLSGILLRTVLSGRDAGVNVRP